ncbi:MAG: GIY-YIG nuclease family protein [Deltaproteobacteria bacterium]
MAFWVYILRCADGSYYTGHTDNLEKRISEHTTGAIVSCYTFRRRPIALVFTQEFTTREEALSSEQQIKGWNRKKKEAMMRGDWAEVSRLARSPNTVPPLVPPPVPPEPVEGLELRACRAVEGLEFVESPETSVHGSTSSPRTEKALV